ncbi:MAG: LegC family aminotransferase [Deltaproteobacteria bacterium]|nr:LegC family aminotransferase [Deltaproteobacteria bacterium]
MTLSEKLYDLLAKQLPCDKGFVALHEPCFAGHEWDYVKECLDTGWVSSVGKYVDQFENDLAEYTGVTKAVACVNGTAALSVALRLVGVQQGDEVLVPALTFIATTNAIAYQGAIPHFVDSEYQSLAVCVNKLESHLKDITEMRDGFCFNKQSGRRIAALVVVHVFGHPAKDIEDLVSLCQKYNIKLVEDAAESLGSFYKGKHTGHFGSVAATSFNGNKILTTGGGGALLTNDPELGKLAKHLTTTAKVPHAWRFNHDMLGYNYRLPNINAALGVAQLEQLPKFLEQKKRLFEAYKQLFAGCDEFELLGPVDGAESNHWLNAIILKPEFTNEFELILNEVNQKGFMLRPLWTLMHHMPMYSDCPRMDLSVAQDLEKRTINIPSSAFLGG